MSDEYEWVKVTELAEDDMIDLTRDPYADPNHDHHGDAPCDFEYEHAVVGGEDGPGEQENDEVYRLDYSIEGGSGACGFPTGHVVKRVKQGGQE